MKINRYLSKKNKIAAGLSAVLIGTTMIGSGIALSGYMPNNNQASVATADEAQSEKEILTVEKVVNNLGLPSFIIKNKDINNDINSIVKEQNAESENIEFIKEDSVIYSTDKRIFYNKKDRILQFSVRNKNLNVLNKYTLYENKEFNVNRIYKTKSQKTVYDINGKNLSFNKLDKSGITHSYNTIPIYVLDESVTYCKDYNAINKAFIYYNNSANSASGRYNYTILDHFKNKKLNFAYLRKEVTKLSKTEVKTYTKDDKEIKKFTDAFDNRKFDVLKSGLVIEEQQATTMPTTTVPTTTVPTTTVPKASKKK